MLDVSRETKAKLDRYGALLLKWQRSVNLISPSTLNEVFERHFKDSLQLLPYLPHATKIVFDLGSGAGFPGMVLAIACPDIEFHLIEADHKKCSFLKTVSRETETLVHVHSKRIEEMTLEIEPDIITARALKPIVILCDYALGLAKTRNSTLLLLKGETVDAEISEAEKKYKFSYTFHDSQTHAKGKIVKISNLDRL